MSGQTDGVSGLSAHERTDRRSFGAVRSLVFEAGDGDFSAVPLFLCQNRAV